MKTLFVIPARKGSKGIPGKNIKPLQGKPLIAYSIEFALENCPVEDICISTDDLEVIKIAEFYGIEVPFIRPEQLASDTASSYDVLLHAIDFYEQKGKKYDALVLLQATSPFRKNEHLSNALKAYQQGVEAVVSVCETKSNPYYVLFEENEAGHLKKSKELEITRRQDSPKVYELNGSIYVLSIEAIKKYNSITQFDRIVKTEMSQLYSTDIDDMNDWQYCEFILEKELLDKV